MTYPEALAEKGGIKIADGQDVKNFVISKVSMWTGGLSRAGRLQFRHVDYVYEPGNMLYAVVLLIFSCFRVSLPY